MSTVRGRYPLRCLACAPLGRPVERDGTFPPAPFLRKGVNTVRGRYPLRFFACAPLGRPGGRWWTFPPAPFLRKGVNTVRGLCPLRCLACAPLGRPGGRAHATASRRRISSSSGGRFSAAGRSAWACAKPRWPERAGCGEANRVGRDGLRSQARSIRSVCSAFMLPTPGGWSRFLLASKSPRLRP